MILAVFLFLALDVYLVQKRRSYSAEVARLRGAMSDAERQRTDAIVEAEQDKARIALELAKRQAKMENASPSRSRGGQRKNLPRA